jgi:hypothetical protein
MYRLKNLNTSGWTLRVNYIVLFCIVLIVSGEMYRLKNLNTSGWTLRVNYIVLGSSSYYYYYYSIVLNQSTTRLPVVPKLATRLTT